MVRTNGKECIRTNDDWTMHPDGAVYVASDYAGWTPIEVTRARLKIKVGKRKSRGGSPKEIEKAILVNLALNIPESDRFKWSPDGKNREEIGAQCDILEEGVERAVSLQREWQLVDKLPKGFYNMKLVWHHMGHFGAINRAQSDAVLVVLQDIKKDLHARLEEMAVTERFAGMLGDGDSYGDHGDDVGQTAII